jgi:probable addiction module antidote protein
VFSVARAYCLPDTLMHPISQQLRETCFEDNAGDGLLIRTALNDIARAQGMTQVARDAGLGRESLYKALSSTGNPEFATIMKVMKALGLKLHARAV